MGDELKPCPFCGGEARIHSKVLAEGFDSGYWAVCDECGKGDTLPHESEEKAAAAWNARAAVADEQFSLAVHDGEAWQRVQECHIRYHGGMVSEGGMEAEDWYYCDACGEELPKWAQDAWSEYADFDFEGAMPFRHCPECGAKVVTC